MVGQVDEKGREVVGEGCLRGVWGGVVTDGGEMGSVCGNLCVRVVELREWLDSGSERRPLCRISAQVVLIALGIWVGRA